MNENEALDADLSYDSVCGAIARAWAYPENDDKTMDEDLALAAAAEVMALIHRSEQAALDAPPPTLNAFHVEDAWAAAERATELLATGDWRLIVEAFHLAEELGPLVDPAAHLREALQRSCRRRRAEAALAFVTEMAAIEHDEAQQGSGVVVIHHPDTRDSIGRLPRIGPGDYGLPPDGEKG